MHFFLQLRQEFYLLNILIIACSDRLSKLDLFKSALTDSPARSVILVIGLGDLLPPLYFIFAVFKEVALVIEVKFVESEFTSQILAFGASLK